VHGTTGYNFLNVLNGLFVRGDRLDELRRAYRRFAGEHRSAADEVYHSKRSIMLTSLASEHNVLAHALNRLSEADRRTRDFTLNTLRRTLMEVVASFPVYRTYVTPEGATPEDVRIIDRAIAEARRRDPVLESSIFAFIRGVLLPHAAGDDSGASREARTQFAMKLQQFTGPVEAKGLEDTAFYRDVALVSANEVGGDPHHRARTDEEFHAANAARLARWPFEMTTTSTHDTKRGEDVRTRIDVISEMPDAWRRLVGKWAAVNSGHRQAGPQGPAPDRNDEWMFYQTLTGAWPAGPPDAPLPERAPDALVERLSEYMLKAVREAKRHTSWVNANAAYDGAVTHFVRGVLTGDTSRAFLASFVPWQRRVAWFGAMASLAQVVLKIASPGMPDTYQGGELWDLALVDPDNRRPVDFETRREQLAALEPLLVHAEGRAAEEPAGGAAPAGEARAARAALLDSWWDGRVKLYTLATALRLRRALPQLFLLGDYVPLTADEENAHVVGFARRTAGATVIAVVPRFLATRLGGEPRPPLGPEVWQTTRLALPGTLAARTFVNAFTGETVRPPGHRDAVWLLAGDVFTSWPVALLVAV
jgi:(1->4)-alpha-D-glucan 1-alpha-D-glucosylmutase